MSRNIIKIAAVGGACAAIGAGAGILGSASAQTQTQKRAGARGHHGHARAGALRPLRRAVHLDAVMPTRNGQFVTVTMDRGVVQSVNGNDITLNEGTPKATYKSVTITVPSNAVVRDNGKAAALADIKPGQVAFVVQGPNHARVGAHDPRAGGS